MTDDKPTTSLALAVVTGTLEEKVKAFQQISSTAAAMVFSAYGYDTVPKILAACWNADALMVHPATYMTSVWAIEMERGGRKRTVIEPRWEFLHALLKSRLPGFKFKVIAKTPEKCELYFADGDGNEHTEIYTMADAQRQGLAAKETYKSNPVEMLFKQCYKRGADVIGAHILMGLPPTRYDDDAVEPPPQRPPDALDKAITGEGEKPEPAKKKAKATAPPPAAGRSPILRLSDMLAKRYGSMKPAEALQKTTILYNQMVKEQTGANPRRVFSRVDELGPVEAEQMISYLTEYDARKAKAAKPEEHVDPETGEIVDPETGEVTDAAPEPETPPEPETTPVHEAPDYGPPDEDGAITYDSFLVLVKRARGIFKRQFLKESPTGSHSYWFIDQETFGKLGYPTSVHMQKDGAQKIDQQALEGLYKVLAEDCDEAERSRR